MLPTCDHVYASDYKWYKHHIADLTRDYEGQLWTQSEAWTEKNQDIDPGQWGIKCLTAKTQAKGLSRDKDVIHTLSNSGAAAIGLAYRLGATRIILLGFDMMLSGGKRHWFGNHPDQLHVGSNYQQFMATIATIKPEEYGIEIWNCSRRTALKCFPIYNLDDL